jgi:hypothetical protein
VFLRLSYTPSIWYAGILLVTNTEVIYCQRFYRLLELKSKQPDAAVPPLDETLKKITEPDPELLSQNKSVIDAFRRIFELKEKPKVTFADALSKKKKWCAVKFNMVIEVLNFIWIAAEEIKSAIFARKPIWIEQGRGLR